MAPVRTWLRIYDDVLLQRWNVRHLRGLRPDDLCDDVAGRTFIVTGPTSGIGTEIAAALARKGAHVVLACRSVPRGEALAASLRAAAASYGHAEPLLEVQELDVSSLDSVRAFADAWSRGPRARPLACLVNNAGIFDMAAKKPARDGAGHEAHWATNFLGPTLLTLLLLPSLRLCPGARVVSVSSIMHTVGTLDLGDPAYARRPFTATGAYAASKLAGVAFSKELERRLEAGGVDVRVLSVHPGNVVTGVVRTLPSAVQLMYRVVFGTLLLSPEEGARSSVFCAGAASAAAAPRPGPYFDSTCALAPHAPAADLVGQQLWEYTLSTLQLDERDLALTGAK